MSARVTEVENQGIIEIRDPEIDIADIMRRIRQNMAVREKLPPLAAALGQVKLLDERKRFFAIVQELHARMRNYGAVETLQTGWKGKAELLVKKCIRKICHRYIAQQQEVHGKLLEALNQVAGYLDQQDEVLRLRFDQCDRLLRETTELLRPTPLSAVRGKSPGESSAA